MEELNRYLPALQEALEKYKSHLDKTELPALKEQYRLLHASLKALWDVLLKKGLLREDPYKADSRISEISNPPEDNFLDSEKMEKMSIRLSMLESQFDFLNNYYQFSIDFLDLTRVRLLLNLTRYINWDQFSENSANLNTKSLAELVGKIKKAGETLSSGIVNDAVESIRKSARRCLSGLKLLANYHKELYKLEVRLVSMPQVSVDPLRAVDKKDEITRSVKKTFVRDFPGRPYYPELVHEIIDEDYGPDSADRHRDTLSSLTVKEDRPKQVREAVSFHAMLLDALRVLSSSSRYLDEALRKLVDNSQILEHRSMTMFEKFRRWVLKSLQKQEAPLTYDVEYFDVTTSTTKHEKIDFRTFVNDVEKKARLFGSILGRVGAAYKKLEAASEDQVFTFLNRNSEDLNLIHRRMGALDTFFKSEVPKDDRSGLRGVKIELTAIKNSIVKANQKKHEYVARRDEAEQMKKLGINLNAT